MIGKKTSTKQLKENFEHLLYNARMCIGLLEVLCRSQCYWSDVFTAVLVLLLLFCLVRCYI